MSENERVDTPLHESISDVGGDMDGGKPSSEWGEEEEKPPLTIEEDSKLGIDGLEEGEEPKPSSLEMQEIHEMAQIQQKFNESNLQLQTNLLMQRAMEASNQEEEEDKSNQLINNQSSSHILNSPNHLLGTNSNHLSNNLMGTTSNNLMGNNPNNLMGSNSSHLLSSPNHLLGSAQSGGEGGVTTAHQIFPNSLDPAGVKSLLERTAVRGLQPAMQQLQPQQLLMHQQQFLSPEGLSYVANQQHGYLNIQVRFWMLKTILIQFCFLNISTFR